MEVVGRPKGQPLLEDFLVILALLQLVSWRISLEKAGLRVKKTPESWVVADDLFKES